MGEKLAADSVRISETEVDLLMARLDDQAMPADQDQRRSKRQAFRQPTVVLRLVEPGGNDSTYVVHPRNLSGNGIGFLHDNFMYPGTTCRILLKTLNLACVEIQGKVVRCRNVHAQLHEIGMEFDEPIETCLFIDRDAKQSA